MALWDGITTDSSSQIIIIGATNRPNDIDPAVRRRMPVKFYVPMPSSPQRCQIFRKVLKAEKVSESVDYETLGHKSEGLSGSDITEVCRQAVIKQMNLALENNGDVLDDVTFEDLLVEIDKFKSPLLKQEDYLD